MVFRSSARRTLLAGLSVLLLASCAPSRPAPMEESDLRRAREIWEERRHRTPPGVSWRQVESENRRGNLELRAALFQEGAADAPLVHWRERGSFDQTGRTHVTAVGSDGQTLFIGTDNGGVFSGVPGTRRWEPRSDGLGIGVESFVIVPGVGPKASGNPEAWIASDLYGPLYVTTNSGLTWSPARGGPTSDERMVRLLRDPGRARTVYALASESPRYRLYRSDDGGLSFKLASTGRNEGTPDLWIDRLRGGPLYLATQQGLKISINRGTTFQPVSTLPVPVLDVVLAGSEAGAPTLYAAIRRPQKSAWELFVSEDAGRTWRAGSRLPDFWLTLTASLTNPRLVFAGGIHAYRSIDAGRHFKAINQWGEYYAAPGTRLHADVPGIDCLLYGGQEVFFFNTDGGTFLSRNGGRTVRNITRYGLGNGQYYDLLTSRNNSALIAAGSQDQGYQVSRPGPGGLLGFDQWESGDYGSLTSSDGTHNMMYSAYPGFLLVQPSEGVRNLESFSFPVSPGERRHPWIPAIAADPEDPGILYFADRRIWQMDRQGPSSYTSQVRPRDFGQGAQPDYITALAISPADPDRWYAGTQYGRIWVSHDRGWIWTLRKNVPYFSVSDILPSPTDPDVAYIAGSGYDGTPVYRTTNGGKTWQPHSNGLPPTLADALAFDDPARQELYVATDAGPFRYDEAFETWINLLGTQAPLTDYTDVEGVPAEGIVRFATYGRGIWDYSPAGHFEAP
jgi:hypothetical protein